LFYNILKTDGKGEVIVEKLALYGGKKAKTVPYGTGRRFGEAELTQLSEALEQNTLFYWKGGKAKQFSEKFAEMYGAKHCVCTSSGTAAIHTALGAVGVTAGDEVITAPITDMGSVIGILYQNAIPIFADVEPHTYNMSAKSIEEKITDKTKAILVVHLAGNPADMDAIMEIAHRHNIYVVEDCAQSYLCHYKGRLAGTMGDIGCFSLNDFKHISAGDGGMCITNDENLFHKAFRFADKNYDRLGKSLRSVESLAPNYRINELTAAVGLAQLDRLEWICSQRGKYGEALTEGIRGLPGIYPHEVKSGNKSSCWFYMFRINEAEAGVSREKFCEALKAEGVSASAGYIPTCVYEYDMFTKQNAYEGTHCPFDCPLYGEKVEYKTGMCPTAEEVLKTVIKLTVNEFYTEQDLKETIHGIRKVSKALSK